MCFSLFSNLYATNVHTHPQAKNSDSKSTVRAYSCEIQIINQSYFNVFVYGVFDDGSRIEFPIYQGDAPHYIDLYYGYTPYDSYCHNGMNLTIESPYGIVYSGWANVNDTIRIVPYMNKQAKAEISSR